MRSVFLFQRDLRVDHHELVERACKESDELVFALIEPQNFNQVEPELGFKMWGDCRKKFYFQALESLTQKISDERFDFLIFKSCEKFHAFLELENINTIYSTHSPLQYENLYKINLPARVNVITELCGFLINPKHLRFPFSSSTSFTKFRKAVEKAQWPVANGGVTFKAAIAEGKAKAMKFATDSDSECQKTQDWIKKFLVNLQFTDLAFKIQGSREFALDHLNNYVWITKHIQHYKNTRNGMIELYDSSKLSAWLALGVLSVSEVFNNIVQFEERWGSNSSTYWLKLELLWREYFKWIAESCGDQLFLLSGISRTYKLMSERSAEDLEVFRKWAEGLTQNNFINANMKELALTGFMSNRGRQNVASHLVHELRQPWLWGAKWFESQLLDFDPASNYGNWQYITGAGHWGEHKFDYEWQANTYDPNREYQKLWNSKKLKATATIKGTKNF